MSGAGHIRVVVVDDHDLLREGVTSCLSGFDNLEVVGEASNGEAAIREVRRLAPDVVVVDVVMPGMDGVEVIRRLRVEHPTIGLLALSSFTELARIRDVIQAGANGYLVKSVDAESLAEAVRSAATGRGAFSAEVTQILALGTDRPTSALETLTPREAEIAELLAKGRSNAEIAKALELSLFTVKNHVSKILMKLELVSGENLTSGVFSYKGAPISVRAQKKQNITSFQMDEDGTEPIRMEWETIQEGDQIRYKGKNIHEVLGMTVEEAREFFDPVPLVARKLQTLIDVGLSYLHLGQSATTLSGGEAQRVKLARELSKRDTTRTLYILDEPTTGLHFHDIKQLLEVLHRLRDKGNTIIVIEHNLDVIWASDWLIDLGPEGGEGGGNIVATGTPEEVMNNAASYTGQFLLKHVRRNEKSVSK
jgi:DNA-binding NarL/FixJ family response regulator/ABC-type antimicrobial peptide transport system ATPase subunit